MKKNLMIGLSLCLVLFFCTSMFTSCKTNKQLRYWINEDQVSCTITGIGTYKGTDIVIDPYIDGYKVTAISRHAFTNRDNITSVTIPEGVTTIEYEAFHNCVNLEKITIPDSVTHIGIRAFYATKYFNTESNWEDDVLYIDNHLIKARGTVLEKDVIKAGTKTIAGDAFNNCPNLTSITLPESVVGIGDYAFFQCRNISSVVIPEGVIEIGEHAFALCENLTSITLPDSIIHIGAGAFASTPYTNTESNPHIEDGVVYIDNHLIGANIAISGNYIIKTGIKTLADYAFGGCTNLNSIIIPSSVKNIGNSTFSDCTGLTSVAIPDSVTSIGDSAFSGCASLTSINIPDSVTYFGDYAFYGCSALTSAVIGNGVTSIGDCAFIDCTGLTSIVIPDSVTSIGDSAFNNCSSLTSIVIPDSVTSIGDYAFGSCSGLTDIYFTGTKTEWKAITKGFDWDYVIPSYTIHYNYVPNN